MPNPVSVSSHSTIPLTKPSAFFLSNPNFTCTIAQILLGRALAPNHCRLIKSPQWCKEAKFKPLVLVGLFMAPLYWMTFTPLAQLNYADPHNHLGVVYWYKGKIPEAERSFLKAFELNQGFEYPLLNLVNMFRLQGNVEKETEYRNRYEAWKQRYKPNSF